MANRAQEQLRISKTRSLPPEIQQRIKETLNHYKNGLTFEELSQVYWRSYRRQDSRNLNEIAREYGYKDLKDLMLCHTHIGTVIGMKNGYSVVKPVQIDADRTINNHYNHQPPRPTERTGAIPRSQQPRTQHYGHDAKTHLVKSVKPKLIQEDARSSTTGSVSETQRLQENLLQTKQKNATFAQLYTEEVSENAMLVIPPRLKSNLMDLIKAHPAGIPVHQLVEKFSDKHFYAFNYVEYGCMSLVHFCISLPSIFVTKNEKDGFTVYPAVEGTLDERFNELMPANIAKQGKIMEQRNCSYCISIF